MEIKELEKYNFGETRKKEDGSGEYEKPSFIQKSLGSMVDFVVVFFLRMLLSVIFGFIWFFLGLKKMIEQSGGNMEVLVKMGIIPQFAVFAFTVLVGGGFYYIYFYSSKYGTTVGGMFYKMKLICRKTGEVPSMIRSAFRYFLYLVPFLFIILAMVIFLKEREVTFSFMVLGLLSMFWYDLWIINRKIGGGVPDLLTGTMLISTKEKRVKKLY